MSEDGFCQTYFKPLISLAHAKQSKKILLFLAFLCDFLLQTNKVRGTIHNSEARRELTDRNIRKQLIFVINKYVTHHPLAHQVFTAHNCIAAADSVVVLF